MMPHQFHHLLDKYISGACTPEEEQLIADWYNNIGKTGQSLHTQEDNKQVQTKIWAAINPSPTQGRTVLFWLLRAAMISIPILAGTYLYFKGPALSTIVNASRQASYQSHQTEKRFVNKSEAVQKIALLDGSEVTLQPSSELYVNDGYGEKRREVRLKGEAFFKVRRNPEKPFVVYSNEVVTRVLGTSFIVRAYEGDGEITVAVKTGRVSVSANKRDDSRPDENIQREEVILTPNQQMVYQRKQAKASKGLVEKPEIILPNSNLFTMQFENTEILKIFQVLEENYGIEIRCDRQILQNCKLTTSMSDEGLYERIAVICKAIGASYSIDEDAVITIQSTGC
jgi:transmembrane sensor